MLAAALAAAAETCRKLGGKPPQNLLLQAHAAVTLAASAGAASVAAVAGLAAITRCLLSRLAQQCAGQLAR
jgi:hypothetical protein